MSLSTMVSRRRVDIAAIAVTVVALAVAFTGAYTTGGAKGGRTPSLAAAYAAATGPRPPVVTGPGPAPGDFARDWATKTVADPGTAYRVVGGEILARSTDAIEAYDASTGALRWYLRGTRIDETITGYVADASTVLIDRDADSGPQLWTALDTATGRVLWNKALGLMTGDIYDGVVTMTRTRTVDGFDVTTIAGVDVRTGDVRWSFRNDSHPTCGIDSGPEQATAGLLVFHASCSHQSTLMAFRASDGRLVWERPGQAQAAGGTRLGSVLYRTPDTGRASLTRMDGRTITTLPATFTPDNDLVPPVAAGDYVVLPGRSDGAKNASGYLAVADIRTGATVVHPADDIRALTSDGRRAYAVVGDVGSGVQDSVLDSAVGDELRPAAVDVIDLVTGATQRLPLPVPGGGNSGGDSSYPYWIAAVGGHLFLAIRPQSGGDEARTELMSVSVAGTAGPLALGGVPGRAWPDACTLAPGYRVVPNHLDPGRVTLGGTTPARVGCAYAMPAGRSATVTVGWIARTPVAAHELMTDLESGFPESVGDEAVSYPGTNGAPARTVMRVGATIVTFVFAFTSMPPDADDERLMTVVATTLRRS